MKATSGEPTYSLGVWNWLSITVLVISVISCLIRATLSMKNWQKVFDIAAQSSSRSVGAGTLCSSCRAVFHIFFESPADSMIFALSTSARPDVTC